MTVTSAAEGQRGSRADSSDFAGCTDQVKFSADLADHKRWEESAQIGDRRASAGMTDGASEVSPWFAASQGCRRINPFRFRCVSVVFVSLAALCVGCQSIPDDNRSSALSPDMPLPALPSNEADDDGESEPRPSRELDADEPADGSDAEPRPFLGFPIGKLLDDSLEDDDDDDPPKRKACRET